MLSTERIQQIRQRLAAATPGPWFSYESGQEVMRGQMPGDYAPIASLVFNPADNAFIAAAPDDVRDLLDDKERAQRFVERVRATVRTSTTIDLYASDQHSPILTILHERLLQALETYDGIQ